MHTISGLRQHKQSGVRRLRNHAVKSRLRNSLKKVLAAIRKQDAEAARTAFAEARRLIDRASSKGVIHRNKANRHKSRLAGRVNALAKNGSAPATSSAPHGATGK